jgi:VWFA-related protein
MRKRMMEWSAAACRRHGLRQLAAALASKAAISPNPWHRNATALLFLLFASAAVAQVTETIEVRVANIDVVVTDRDGHPVHGLTAADFDLFENKKPQTITHCSEIRGDQPESATAATATTAAPAPSPDNTSVRPDPGRNIVVFIDNSSIDPLRRNQVIESIQKTLDKLMRPGDEAMVATWNRHFETVQRFTSDRAEIRKTLEVSKSYGASASSFPVQKATVMTEARNYYALAREGRMTMADAYGASVGAARAYAQSLRQVELLLMKSMTQAVVTLSGGDARKIMIFVGGELESKPGLDVFQVVDTLFEGSIKNAMPAVIRENDLNTNDEILKLARDANANGVTMYMLDALDRTSNSAENSAMSNPEVEFTQETNSYFSMQRLATNTGGTVLSGSRNFTLALDNIARDLGSYYSLGYKPSADGGRDRTIVVKAKKPGLVVRARRNFTLKNTDEQTSDRVVANAFHSSLKGDFPVTVAAEPPEPFQKGLFKVNLTVTFPSTLTYLPDGNDLAGAYEVYFVMAAEDGGVSPVGKQEQPVKFPANTFEAVKQRPFTHSTALVVKPGTQTLSVVVLDKLGARIGYGRATIIAR